MPTTSFAQKIEFILALGRSLHQCGTAAHHLERALSTAATKLGVEGQYLAFPTGILGSVTDGQEHRSFVIRDHPGPIDLSRLSRLDSLGDQVIAGKTSLQDGMQAIHAIGQMRPDYPPVLHALAYAMASGGMVTSLKGTWSDFMVASVIGLLIGIIDLLGERWELLQRLFGALASLLACVGAILLARVLPDLNPDIVILASIVVLLPGLALVVAFVELSTKNLIAGTARLMGAFGELLKIVFTIALAKRLLAPWTTDVLLPTEALPPWMAILGVLGLSFGFIVLFKVRPIHILSAFIVSVSSYSIAKFGSLQLGTELAFFVAGAWVAIVSNSLARLMHRPGLITLMPGIILIVPGSINYRGFVAMFQYNVMDTLSTVFSVVIIAVSIVAGLFFGATVVPPRRSL